MREFMNPTETKKESVTTDPEVAKDLANEAINNQVEETLDVQPNNEKVDELSEIKAKMETYRENIKKGETKDGRGNYNEALVLENEAKLRQAEKTIQGIRVEETNNREIVELEEKINKYREQIKDAEQKYDEKSVLENEDKLRETEKKILELKKEISEAKNVENSPSKEEIEIEEIRKGFQAEMEKENSKSEKAEQSKEASTKKNKVKKSFWQKFSDFMNK